MNDIAPIRNSDFTQHVEALDDAVKILYRTFKRYPFLPEITTKFCRRGPTPLNHSLRLRQVTADQLEWAAGSGLNTWGTLAEFNAVLPRMLEHVTQTGSVAGTSAPHLFTHLRGLAFWNDKEREALLKYTDAIWNRGISEFPASLMRTDELLCMVAMVLDDLTPVLDQLERSFDPATARHLAQWVVDVGNRSTKKRGLPDAFWTSRKPQAEQAIAFLCRPSLRNHMEHLAEKFGQRDGNPLFAHAIAVLRLQFSAL